MDRKSILALGLAVASLAPASARAFCGFYVGSAEADLVNEATMVVLLRDGTKTVLSMQNDYQGPPEDFALVVPVPVVLSEEEVRTLPRDVFQRVERLAAPRLVEYWEQDPCEVPHDGIGLGNIGTIGRGGGGGAGSGYGRGAAPLVTVEAEFAVGEYDIVILGARDSGALDTWLREHGYRIPAGAGEVLRPYVAQEMKFFVAKVDVERVTFEEGRAVLSPLRVHYDSEEFSLPVRLGLLNSSGAQDLIVHVLANNQRYDVANYENVAIPTNIDVTPDARTRFAEFYAALFDRVSEQNPGAVVTEYAWQATNCDPCPGPVLSAADILTLGGDIVRGSSSVQVSGGGAGFGFGFRGRAASVPRVRAGNAQITGALDREIVRRIVRRHINELRFCYQQQVNQNPNLQGTVTFQAVISPTGAIQSAEVSDSTLGNAVAEQCMATAWRRWRFPEPQGGGIVRVTYPIAFSMSGGGGTVGRGTIGGFGRMGGGPFMNMVLTRLHYRYGRDDLGEDLVFRPADPIIGGREIRGPDGKLEQGASPAGANNFQARYAIRHEWEGALECDNPRRGRWGGPPAGATDRGTAAATDLARAPRGTASLGSFLTSTRPDLGVTAIGQAVRPTAQEADEAEEQGAPPEPEVVAPPPPTTAAEGAGCGCRLAGASERAPLGVAAAVLLALVLARRRRG